MMSDISLPVPNVDDDVAAFALRRVLQSTCHPFWAYVMHQ